jgi:hypothetical protein
VRCDVVINDDDLFCGWRCPRARMPQEDGIGSGALRRRVRKSVLALFGEADPLPPPPPVVHRMVDPAQQQKGGPTTTPSASTDAAVRQTPAVAKPVWADRGGGTYKSAPTPTGVAQVRAPPAPSARVAPTTAVIDR